MDSQTHMKKVVTIVLEISHGLGKEELKAKFNKIRQELLLTEQILGISSFKCSPIDISEMFEVLRFKFMENECPNVYVDMIMNMINNIECFVKMLESQYINGSGYIMLSESIRSCEEYFIQVRNFNQNLKHKAYFHQWNPMLNFCVELRKWLFAVSDLYDVESIQNNALKDRVLKEIKIRIPLVDQDGNCVSPNHGNALINLITTDKYYKYRSMNYKRQFCFKLKDPSKVYPVIKNLKQIIDASFPNIMF